MDPLDRYYELLKEWNARVNLTALDGKTDFCQKHAADSRQLLPYIKDASRVLDLGTGAGIPGIILKILKPDVEVVLIDSTRKKISFCNEVIRNLGLKDISAVWGRAEDASLQRSVGKFDVVVSRATWKLHEYLGIAENYVREGGVCIAMKGPRWADELAHAAGTLKKTGFSLQGTHPYKLEGGEERCLLVFSV